MSTRKNFDIRSIELSTGYSMAVPGTKFTAFVSDATNYICYPKEDKERIKYLCEIYRRRIKKLSHYEIMVEGNKNMVSGESIEALSYFLGLPKMSFKYLDLTKPIPTQLAYADIDEELVDKMNVFAVQVPKDDEKKNNFRIYAEETFRDNLSHGIYIEVDGDVRDIEIIGPIDIDIPRLYQEDRNLINSFNSDRVLIDFAYLIDEASLSEAKQVLDKIDGYRIDDVYNYLAGYEENDYLSGLGFNEFEKDLLNKIYTELVKAIFLFTYDRLCYAKHSLESNICYLTRGMRAFNCAYTSSSFNADMFSNDNVDYFFDIDDKERLIAAEELLSNKNDTDPAVRYARLSLPYEGYVYLKKLGLPKDAPIAENLPYTDTVTSEDGYNASKRESGIYSFNIGDQRHDYAVYFRYFLTQGIELKPLDVSPHISEMFYSLKVCDIERTDKTIATLLSKDGLLLSDKVLNEYILDNALPGDEELKHDLEIIDGKYGGKANLFFFSDFEATDVKEIVKVMIEGTPVECTKHLIDFFAFFFDELFTAADTALRKTMIENNEIDSLTLLDRLGTGNVVYEPKLPLPYVVSGTGYYGFSSSPSGPYFLCECQKESITVQIRMLSNQYSEFAPKGESDKEYRTAMNEYVIDNLGLPDEIANNLNTDEYILSQLRFENKICHICNGTRPVYHHQIFHNPTGSYSSYLHYIDSNAYRHGINTAGLTDYDNIMRYSSLSRYVSQFHFTYDETTIDSKMRAFVDLDMTKATAILSCHYPTILESYSRRFSDLESLGEKTLKDIVFFKSDPKIRRNQLFGCQPLIALLWDYYRRLGYAYAFIYGKEVIGKVPDTVYSGSIHDERFPLPYIYLGRVFNAYSDSENGDFYFCSCDKESMKASITYHLQNAERYFGKKYLTEVTLGLAGFPEQFASRYASYPLSQLNVNEFVDSLNFKDGICHRCRKHALPALTLPFTIALSRKRSRRAEMSNSENLILKDGLIIEKPILFGQYRYDSNIRFDLSEHISNEIPYVVKLGNNTPDLFLEVLRPDQKEFDTLCASFNRRNRREEDSSAALNVIKETYRNDPNVFIDIFTCPNRESTSALTLEERFPSLRNFSGTQKYSIEEKILGFLYMMFEDIFNGYAEKERSMTNER